MAALQFAVEERVGWNRFVEEDGNVRSGSQYYKQQDFTVV